MTQIFTFLIWYICITFLGLVSFPLTYRLLPGLKDRGYSLSRVLGLLVWGYFFWLLASLGVLRNDIGGLILALIVLVVLSFWAYRGLPAYELRSWWNDNRRLVLSIEILFFVVFAGWTIVRATNPEILGTEKPMELAFINAILRSPIFPPHDPWLSGYAISYYYFGYVMTAMLAKLTVTPGSIAFNLAVSMIFALTSITAYGVLYSLLSALKVRKESSNQNKDSQNLILSLFGPLFILIVSNLEGFLEILHSRGLFWKVNETGQLTSTFWSWLDLKELSLPPAQPFSWIPSRFLWWWRASRVVQDYDLAGNWREVIDEFPFFSFLLADLHPHVLAMPFALLAVGIALNVFFGGGIGSTRWLGIKLAIKPSVFWSSALIIGGLAFLNTWDFPMYLLLFSLAYVYWRWIENRKALLSTENGISSPEDEEQQARSPLSFMAMGKEFLVIGFTLGVSGILLYLPFYIGLSSQAGGILPNLIYSTRGTHLWIMFGALLLPIIVYLIYLWSRRRKQIRAGQGILLALGFTLILWLTSLLFGLGLANLPFFGNIFVNSLGGDPVNNIFAEAIVRRFTGTGWVTLLLLLGLTFGLILAKIRPKNNQGTLQTQYTHESRISEPIWSLTATSHDFVLILILIGSFLVIFTEFFYLRDQFGSRMNTIFKFYFQTWILWGMAAAFGTVVLLKRLRGYWGVAFRIGLVGLFFMALVYPFLSLWHKTNGFNPASGLTLNGAAYLEASAPEEMAAIHWFESAPSGVVIEAVGGQYSEYARVATLSGQPNVLGWPGHERQWRGGSQEIGSREEDIQIIYQTNDWEDTKGLLDFYNVRYIFVGPLERRTYRVNESKFANFLGEPVFESGQVSIYQVPRDLNPSDSN
jgi:YYY domain-containing protein